MIKNDGLCGGKGVWVSGDHLDLNQGLTKCEELVSEGKSFLIEEKLCGKEFSLMSFSDGMSVKHMPIAVDFKRAFDGDNGPNTGGMGCITFEGGKAPFLDNKDLQIAMDLNKQVCSALKKDLGGNGYCGVLYGSYMKTSNG